MIDLTIKTLDSQNRSFNVPEDFTVRQLKEHIAESVNIAPDVQRLIYCGRVLFDETKLSTYNVHGKVIHLVERAPPSASTGRGDPDGATSGGENEGWRRFGTRQMARRGSGWRGRGGRGGDNTMYLGAMAFPADLMDARGMSIPQARPCLTRSRLVVARSMLNQASRLLTRLENPRTTDSEPNGSAGQEEVNAQESSQETAESQESVDMVSRRNSTSGDSQSEDNDEANIDLATQAATAAALVSAVSAVMQDAGSSSTQPSQELDITIEEVESSSTPLLDTLLSNTEDASSPISPIVLSPGTPVAEEREAPLPSNMETEPQVATTSNDPNATDATNTAPVLGENDSSDRASSTTDTGSAQQQRVSTPARPQNMGAVIAQLDELNRTLQPYMTQYYNLLHHDPNYEDPEIAQAATQYNYPSSAADADALFRTVSEIMHSLSHSYHALSDIVCSYQRQPASEGRLLRCRPVLIQHSAVLHTPVPLIVERGAVNNNRASSAASSSSSGTSVSSANATASATSTTNSTSSANSGSATQPNTGTPRPAFSSNNLDIFMELGPTITIDSVEATFLSGATTAAPATTSGTTAQANAPGTAPSLIPIGGFPWGSAPPPELIQNLVQAVSERMGEAGEANIHIAFPEISFNTSRPATGGNANAANPASTATTTSAPASTSPTGGARPGPEVQNSQARGNTETHPTTATQTRSTARPQILLARNLSSVARNLQNHLRTFDPFLPCNSHHIRGRRSGATRSQNLQAGAANNNNNNNAATQANNGRPAAAGPNYLGDIADQVAASTNLLTDYLMSRSHDGSGHGGPNILALGPFGSGAATANISFEIGRVPLTVNTGAAGPQARFPTGSSPLSPPVSEQGNGQASLLPYLDIDFNVSINVDVLVEPERSDFNSNAMPVEIPSTIGDSRAVGVSGIGEAPPVSRVETDSTNSNTTGASGANNVSSGAGGLLLSTLLGQLGNLIPQGAGVEMLNGMRNAGGVSVGGEGATGSPWVEISTSAGAMGGRRGPPAEFMNFLQNYASGNPPHVQILRPHIVQTSTTDVSRYPTFTVLIQRLATHESLRNQRNPTLASLLGVETNTTSPNRSYLHDLIYTIINTIRYQHLVSTPNPNVPRIGQQVGTPESMDLVQDFMRRHHSRITDEVVETQSRVIQDQIEAFFNSMPQLLSQVIDGIDLRATLANLNREWLPTLLNAMQPSVSAFPRIDQSRLHESLRKYLQTLLVVLGLCFENFNLPSVITAIVNRLVRGIGAENDSAPFALVSPSHLGQINALLAALPVVIRELTAAIPMANGMRYLVHNSEIPRPPRVGVTPQVTSNPAPRGGEPMDIESAADVSQVASAPVNTRPNDPLPDNIIIGSESWHNTIPSDWVPIITRDSQRQRRDANQGPFSDAYLSGMPTKRRKIVTSNKPSTNLTRVISDTMSSALAQAGVASSSQSEAIATAAAQDPALRAAYRDQMQAQLGDSLASNSDFTSERYPNAAKFFDAKKKQ